MKPNKKAITALSFALGTCIFISTAFADVMIGSGYDQLKDSIKLTAAQMEKGLGNYTIEMLYSLKDNEQLVLQSTTTAKTDTEGRLSEETTLTQFANGDTSSQYSYSDKKRSIWKNGADEQYYVNEFPKEVDRKNPFANPFEERGAQEIEKIVDAVVGNLKDYVQAEDRPDGGKTYSGSLSEAQVPAIVNAVSAFGMKEIIPDGGRSPRFEDLSPIETDIYVKKITGTAAENKDGLLESLTGDVILSGKDKNGAQHDLSLSVAVKLTDIGHTKISPPDLTGANVEKVGRAAGFSSKSVGLYKNNIVMEKNGQVVKMGERILEITSVDGDKITGKYYETVKPEFESEYGEKYNFTFEYSPSPEDPMPVFMYTKDNGEKEHGQIHDGGLGKIYLDLHIEMMDDQSFRSKLRPFYDGQFYRVFEE